MKLEINMGFETKTSEVKYMKPQSADEIKAGVAPSGTTILPKSSLTAQYTGKRESEKFQNTFTHYFTNTDGSKIGVNGCSELDKKLSLVAEGSIVKVEYKGLREYDTAKGAVKAHSYWVEAKDGDGVFQPSIYKYSDLDSNKIVGAPVAGYESYAEKTDGGSTDEFAGSEEVATDSYRS